MRIQKNVNPGMRIRNTRCGSATRLKNNVFQSFGNTVEPRKKKIHYQKYA